MSKRIYFIQSMASVQIPAAWMKGKKGGKIGGQSWFIGPKIQIIKKFNELRLH